MKLIEGEKVKDFIGEYSPEHSLLNPEMPISHGPYDSATFYIENKRQQAESMKNVKKAGS